MKRWSNTTYTQKEIPEIDAFMADLERVCQQHGMSLSHEDGQGAFQVTKYNADDQRWVAAAHDNRDPRKHKKGW